jgi:tetratricopeptide (TPR) repeat protein
LRRRTPRKADFLRYIQDELQLEKLRQLRTKKQQALERERLAKLNKLQPDDNMTSKNHLGDSHIIQLIHLLFRRTLRKYNKEDVSIYLQYADVCKQLKSWNKLPQVYAEAVQIHPHTTGLWIEAASHEFFHRQSISSARILLQRALRINKSAKDLWWQSLALEFHHIAKMQGRKAVLKLKTDDEEGGTADIGDLKSPMYAIAKIVYDNAIEAIPNDVSFRLGFLDLCRTFPYTENMEAYIMETIRRDFQDTPKAWVARAAHILEKQQNRDDENDQIGFTVAPEGSSDEEDGDESSSNNEASGPVRKRQKIKDSSDTEVTDPVLAILKEATVSVSTSEMYLECIRFARFYWEKAGEVISDPKTLQSTRKHILGFIQDLFEDASKDEAIYSSTLALEHAEYYIHRDMNQEALQLLTKYLEAVIETNPPAGNLTLLWLRLATLSFQEESAVAARPVLRRALKHTPITHPDYLTLLLENFGAELAVSESEDDNIDNRKDVTELFQQILLVSAAGSVANAGTSDDDTELSERTPTFGVSSVAEACLQFAMYCVKAIGPLEGVRKAYKMVLLQSNFVESRDGKTMEDIESLSAFFDKCIEVEETHAKNRAGKSKSGQKKDRLRLRQLYEAAIHLFKDIPSLADKYHQGRNAIVLV